MSARPERGLRDCYAASMNRQIRREQERKQEKQDKEKEKRRSDRRKRRDEAKKARQRRREEGKSDRTGTAEERPAKSGRRPGRFSGALAAATVFFILLQSIVPTEDTGILSTFVSAGFYLLFGYFSTLWLLRRGTPRAVVFSLVAGGMLGFGVELGKFLQPELAFDPVLAAMILPAIVLGALLGRLVYFNAPA